MSECRRNGCKAEGETRAKYDGFCSLQCRDYSEYEQEITSLKAEMESWRRVSERLEREKQKAEAENEMKDKRIDWTVEDNAKKAIEIADLKAENADYKALYYAEQGYVIRLQAEKAELRQLLKESKCPNCDGCGFNVYADSHGEPQQEQCQWCYEKNALIPTPPEDENETN